MSVTLLSAAEVLWAPAAQLVLWAALLEALPHETVRN